MKTINIFLAAVAAIIAISCNKDVRMAMPEAEKMPCTPISFNVDGVYLDFATKVDVVTSLESFNVIASTGTAGSEEMTWSTVANKSGDSYVTNKYWPRNDPQYHFYASNNAMTFKPIGPTVVVDGTVDVVCADKRNTIFNAPTNLDFYHVMSRLGTVAVSSTTGYEITGLSIVLNNVKTTGTYNLYSKGWTNQNLVQELAVQNGSNDLYLLPGSYQMSLEFTLVKGDYSGTFSGSGTVDFTAGKISNVSIDIVKDPAVVVRFGVSVADWAQKAVSLTLS
ncbi:MAG: fimbrillin family protein [Bacteroidales bacterium]|nr:fimbrillin family protein [Bacteroidales bacterium]